MKVIYVVVEALCPKTKKYVKVVSSRHPDTLDGHARAVSRSMRMTKQRMPRQFRSISVTRTHP